MEFEIIDLGMHLGQPLHIDVPDGVHTVNVTAGDAPVTFHMKGASARHSSDTEEQWREVGRQRDDAWRRIEQLETDLAIARADQSRAEDARQWVGENCAGLAQQRDEATREVNELRTILHDIRAALGVKDGGDAVVTAKAIYENLGAVQRRCSELLDECRGWRRLPVCGDRSPDGLALGRVVGSVVAERWRQDAKWVAVGPRHLDRPDLKPEIQTRFRKVVADATRNVCDRAAEDGTLTWEHILAEEWAEACAEEEPAKLRAELVQVAAVACSWVQAIDMRTERAENERKAERAAQSSLGWLAPIRSGASA